MLVRNYQLAHAVVAALKSRLAEAGGDVKVLVPPMYGDEFAAPGAAQRLRAWWDTQRAGVELSAATLLIVDAEEMAGLGRVSYVAVPPGETTERSYPRGGAVIEVPSGTIRELVDAVLPGMLGDRGRGEPSQDRRPVFALPRPEWQTKPLWDRQLVRTAVLTGALGFGAWLLSAAVQPGQAQAATVHQQQPQQYQQQQELPQQPQQQYQQQVSDAASAHDTEADFPRSGQTLLEREIRERVTERLRAAGVDEEALRQIQRGLQAPDLSDRGQSGTASARDAMHASSAVDRAETPAGHAPHADYRYSMPGTQHPSAAARAADPRTLPAPESQTPVDSDDVSDEARADSAVPTADLPGLAEQSVADSDAEDEDGEDSEYTGDDAGDAADEDFEESEDSDDEAESAADTPPPDAPSVEGTDGAVEAPRDQPYGGTGTVQAPTDDLSETPTAAPGAPSSGAPPAAAAPESGTGPDVPADGPATASEAEAAARPAPEDGAQSGEPAVNSLANEPAPGPKWDWGEWAGRTFDGAWTGFTTPDALAGAVNDFRDPENAHRHPDLADTDDAKTASKAALKRVPYATALIGAVWNSSAYVAARPQSSEADAWSEVDGGGPDPVEDQSVAFQPTRGEVSAGVAKPPGQEPSMYIPGPVNNGIAGSGALADAVNAPFGAWEPFGGSTADLARAVQEQQASQPTPGEVSAGVAPPPAPPVGEQDVAEAVAQSDPAYAAGKAIAEQQASQPTPEEISAGVAPPPGPSVGQQIYEAVAPSEPGYAAGQALEEQRAEQQASQPTPEEISAGVAPTPEAPEEEAPAPEAPAGEAPASEDPNAPTPEEISAGVAPAPEAPQGEAPAPQEEAPAPEAPAGEAPAPEAPAPEAPAPEAPAPPPAPVG